MNAIADRANAWIVGGDTGLSSKAIWAHMMGAPNPRFGWSHPSDPDDLGRCLRLLEEIPEWKPRLPEMAARSKKWAALVASWDRIEASMIDEVGIDWSRARAAPKTYHIMKSVMGER
jgi:hypothetical protein